MIIEKGQVFELSDSPKVVGVVSSIKDSKQERFYVTTTNGERVIWNNKSQTFTPDYGYTALSSLTLLSPTSEIEDECECCCDCCCEEAEEDSEEVEDIHLETGDIYITENGLKVLLIETLSNDFLGSENSDVNEQYPFIGVLLNANPNFNKVVTHYNINGQAIDGSDYNLESFDAHIEGLADYLN